MLKLIKDRKSLDCLKLSYTNKYWNVSDFELSNKAFPYVVFPIEDQIICSVRFAVIPVETVELVAKELIK